MGNEVIKKDILAGYVHDAVCMEVRKHTINKIRDELILSRDKRLSEQERTMSLMNDKHKRETEKAEREIQIIQDEHTGNINKFDNELEKSKNALEFIESGKNKTKFEWLYLEHPFAPIGCGILGLVIAGGIGATLDEQGIWEQYSDNSPLLILAMIVGCVLICGAIPYIIEKTIWDKDERKESKRALENTKQYMQELRNEQQTELENYKKELSQKQSERRALSAQQLHEKTEAENEMSCEQKIYAELTERIDDISEKLETVDSQLTEFYSVNLIPPDYRSLECVIAFDQMFRNDLVDTMREAALLYDERVFRGEMIKGLNNIYKAINKLGGLMSETVSVLREIESNTSRMCDELVDVSSNLVRMNANVTGHLSTMSANLSSGLNSIADGQRRIESELEYNRYTNEAIRANSDRMRWYTEQRWQGLL